MISSYIAENNVESDDSNNNSNNSQRDDSNNVNSMTNENVIN